MINRQAAEAQLRRVFHGGPLRRVPKKQAEADVIMALSLVGLDSAGFFAESEINVHLSAWLDDIAELDHVTLRRYLVDSGFLRRASDGVIYRVNGEKVDEVLAPDAKLLDPKQLFSEIQTARETRSQKFRKNP